MITFVSGDGVSTITATAATRIQAVLGGLSKFYTTHVTYISYTPGATSHTATLMRGASRSSVTAAVAAAATLVTSAEKLLDGAGNDIAANDYIAVQLDDSTWHLSKVASLDTPKTGITLTTAIPSGRSVIAGAKIVNYGVAGDAYHSQHQFPLPTGSTTTVPAVNGIVLIKAPVNNEPIIFDSDNATNAGTLNFANVAYANL